MAKRKAESARESQETQGSGLTDRQTRTLAALLAEPSVAAAARKLKLDESTLWRMLREPVFAVAYTEARRRMMGEATAALQQAAGEAVAALRARLEGEDGHAIRAAGTILATVFKAVELEDLARRIEALERGNP